MMYSTGWSYLVRCGTRRWKGVFVLCVSIQMWWSVGTWCRIQGLSTCGTTRCRRCGVLWVFRTRDWVGEWWARGRRRWEVWVFSHYHQKRPYVTHWTYGRLLFFFTSIRHRVRCWRIFIQQVHLSSIVRLNWAIEGRQGRGTEGKGGFR